MNFSKKCYSLNQRVEKLGLFGRVTKQELINLFASYLYKCVYCGNEASEVDHIIPLYKRGGGEIENMVPCCAGCNSRKRTKTVIWFMYTDKGFREWNLRLSYGHEKKCQAGQGAEVFLRQRLEESV